MRPVDDRSVVGCDGSGALVSSKSWSVVVSVVGFMLLTSVAAQVRVPVPGTDVPMTLQLLAVLLTGLALTPSRAAGAMLLYLACGVAGFPVFTPHSAGLAGPTAGYLIGFVFGACLVAALKGERDAGFLRLLAAGGMGVVTVFSFGVAWRIALAGLFGGDALLAALTGLLPFGTKAVEELFLAVTLAWLVRDCRRRLARRRAL